MNQKLFPDFLTEITFKMSEHPPPQLRTKKKLTNKSNLFQIVPNGEKIGQKFFFNFGPPQFGTKKLVKNEKNQSCSKLDEMTKKMVRNYFRILDQPNTQFYLG